jgi:hypothetical protein
MEIVPARFEKGDGNVPLGNALAAYPSSSPGNRLQERGYLVYQHPHVHGLQTPPRAEVHLFSACCGTGTW